MLIASSGWPLDAKLKSISSPLFWRSNRIFVRSTVDGCEILHHQTDGWNPNEKIMGCLPPVHISPPFPVAAPVRIDQESMHQILKISRKTPNIQCYMMIFPLKAAIFGVSSPLFGQSYASAENFKPHPRSHRPHPKDLGKCPKLLVICRLVKGKSPQTCWKTTRNGPQCWGTMWNFIALLCFDTFWYCIWGSMRCSSMSLLCRSCKPCFRICSCHACASLGKRWVGTHLTPVWLPGLGGTSCSLALYHFFRLGGVPLNLRRQRWHTTYDHHCGDHMVISICSMVAMKVIVLTVLTPPSMRTLFSCWWCNWFRWFWAFLWRMLHWSTKHASLVRPIVAWTQQGPKQDVASVDAER